MLEYLNNYNGPLTINNIDYVSVAAAKAALEGYEGAITIKFGSEPQKSNNKVQSIADPTIYRIKVRQYMTKPPVPEFDFHAKWNNGNPMPMRIMVGRKIKETKGMLQMELWGQIVESKICMKCGKRLDNPVSQYFGMGPECGGHNYINPFESEEELNKAVKEYDKELSNIRWTGWIIKSALEKFELIR